MGIIEEFNVTESVCETAYEMICLEWYLPHMHTQNVPSMKELVQCSSQSSKVDERSQSLSSSMTMTIDARSPCWLVPYVISTYIL